jgi:hypothetical protein
MKKTPWPVLAMVALGGVACVASPSQAQTAVPVDQLPELVSKTFNGAFPKAEIEKVDAEEENGITVYDFEFTDGPIEKETDIAADGTMLEFTVVVESKEMPAPAMKAIRAAAKGAKIERLEHIEMTYETKDGHVLKLPAIVTRYAAEMTKGKQVGEVVVNPDGSVVMEPTWAAPPEAKPADTKK